MPDQAANEAAMAAVEDALSRDAQSRGEAAEAARIASIDILRRHLAGEELALPVVLDAIDVIAKPLGYCLIDPATVADEDDDWDYLCFDAEELGEARARAERGQIDDTLHHLERALPADYAVIAERLAHAFRSRR